VAAPPAAIPPAAVVPVGAVPVYAAGCGSKGCERRCEGSKQRSKVCTASCTMASVVRVSARSLSSDEPTRERGAELSAPLDGSASTQRLSSARSCRIPIRRSSVSRVPVGRGRDGEHLQAGYRYGARAS
jgi:hypothetical protein